MGTVTRPHPCACCGCAARSSCQVGPRFCLNPVRIFDGSFGGRTLYENPNYVSPNAVRVGR